MRARLFFIIFLITMGTSFAMAGSNQEFIDKQQWSRFSKGYDYTENMKKPKENKTINPAPFKPINASWVKFLVWGLVILILLALITWLIVNIFRGTTEKVRNNQSFQSLTVEDMEEADLEHFLDRSLIAGSFKEAIRIRYLMLIRTLSRLNLVTWKKDKTNGTYVNEMYGKEGFDLFRQLTINFERVWYGEKEIGELEYQRIVPLFDQLNKIVRPNEQSR